MIGNVDANIGVDALQAVAGKPAVVAALRTFYEDADRAIAAYQPVCRNRGLCCRFGTYGHRLYVTALEVVYYLATGQPPSEVTEDTCPHAREGLCQARERRPLGCRVFYCESAAQHWQPAFTEEHLARLRELHDELGVPYFYADWITVLRALVGHVEDGERTSKADRLV